MTDSQENDAVKLDISVNGQHFSGSMDYLFTRKLILHRDIPMSGPVAGMTSTEIIGQSFRVLKSKKVYNAKFGPIKTNSME